MIYVELFLEFFRVGLCAFGGGLATIPFLKELSASRGWFSLDQLADMIAVSESTPGAIGINMSTYVGYTVAYSEYNNVFMALLGGVSSTLGLVAPSIIVILIICQFLKKFRDSKAVNFAFYGLRAASFGLICSAAYSILELSIIDIDGAKNKLNEDNGFFSNLGNAIVEFFDWKCLILAIVMGFFIFKFKKHPILYIAIATVIGIIFKF